MKKFLIINPFGIGDVLFTTPVVRAIKDSSPDSFIGYWCNERVQDILKNNPCINKVFAISRGDIKKIYQHSRLEAIAKSWRLFSALKKEKFDVALDFSLDHRYGLVSMLAGIKTRIGFNYKKRGRFLTHKINIDGYTGRHAVEHYLDLLKFLNLTPKSRGLYLTVPEKYRKKHQIIFERAGISANDIIIGIAPGAGASWGKDAKIKHWPAIRFAQLSDRLIKDLGAKIVVLGDGSERPIADVVANAMQHKPLDLVGKTSLEELISVVNNLGLLITNDGGVLHIAVALDIKTVSIFGPVDERVYGPYPPLELHSVIKKKLDCRPCYKNFKMPVCERDRECINSISVDEVYAAARRLL